MKGRGRNLLIILILALLSARVFSDEFTLDELETLRRTNRISQEDFEILKSELTGNSKDGEAIYALLVNGRIKFSMFRFIKERSENYFPIFSFFQMLEFQNYEFINEKLKMKLGRDLEEVEIDFSKNTIKIGRLGEEIKFNPQDVIKKNSEIYMESALFQKIFLSGLEIDDKKITVKMNLNFNTPREIEYYLKNSLDRKGFKEEKEALFFTNEKMLFDLGYMRVNLRQELTRGEKEKSYQNDWTGELGYQGNLLYGEFTTSYKIKDEVLGDAYLYYPELWNEHSLEVGSYGTKNREWGVSFKKERGYFFSGRDVVIREIVPLGSRAELLYMGFPIEVQTEEDGAVEFRNSEIKTDRDYTIKIYTPDGKIYTVDVNTTVDFRLQNQGQLEYNMDIREDYSSGKYSSSANLYYGLTNNLTLGLGGDRTPKNQSKETDYEKDMTMNLIYSDDIKRVPYTLALGGNYKESGRYTADLEGKIDFGKVKLSTEQVQYSKYYDEKESRTYKIDYNPGGGYRLDYTYHTKTYKEESSKSAYSVGTSLSKAPLKELLMTAEYRRRGNSEDEYSLNMYYTGFYYMNTRVNNKISSDGDYSTNVSLTNKNIWEKVNFSIEIGHSSKDETKVSIKFDLNYKNWLTSGMSLNSGGRQEYTVGLDKVVDLKNITKNIDSMNTSRVKVVTFVDRNNNNIFDEGEETLDNVDVKIGSQQGNTDENGELYFYGVPNGVLYDLRPVVKKPGYIMGSEKISVRGKKVGTIEVNIPVKSLISVSGIISFDEDFLFTQEDMSEIYENTIVKIADKDGNVIELSVPDENGIFDVSGLFPEDYQVEIIYMGKNHKIPTLSEQIKVSYFDRERKIAFNIRNKPVALSVEE